MNPAVLETKTSEHGARRDILRVKQPKRLKPAPDLVVKIRQQARARLLGVAPAHVRGQDGEAQVRRAVPVGLLALHQRDGADRRVGFGQGEEVAAVAVARVLGAEAAREELPHVLARLQGRAARESDEFGRGVDGEQEVAVGVGGRLEVGYGQARGGDGEVGVGHFGGGTFNQVSKEQIRLMASCLRSRDGAIYLSVFIAKLKICCDSTY